MSGMRYLIMRSRDMNVGITAVTGSEKIILDWDLAHLH